MKSPFKIVGEFYTREGKGDLKELPVKGASLYFSLLVRYGLDLIRYNMLTILLCIPVVTAPAAICACNRITIKCALDGVCIMKGEYWEEFRNSAFKCIPVFSLYLFVMVSMAFLIWIGIAGDEVRTVGSFILPSVCVIICLLSTLVLNFFAVLHTSVDLPVLSNLKNALILVFSQPKTDFVLMIPVVLELLAFLRLPYSLLVWILFFPAYTILIRSVAIKPILMKSILTDSEPCTM